ncbi:MAG: HD domain-containing protein [Bdellovibrionales bacterium]|nr:HD domain-containing protein [Bdellovibrionales bacterium]
MSIKINPQEMISVPIERLDFNQRALTNFYIRLSSEKFVLILKTGQRADLQQIKKYKDQSVFDFWVHISEQETINNQIRSVAGLEYPSDCIDIDSKMEVLSEAIDTLFAFSSTNEVSEEVIQNSIQVTQSVVILMESHPSLQDILTTMTSIDDKLLKHGMATSALSVMIAKEMGWRSKVTLEKLALGGLLHDIGMKAIPLEIYKKPLFLLSDDELDWYKTHPFKGAEMLSRIGLISPDVISMVMQHHEKAGGQGYPQHLDLKDIHPYAQILSLADDFADLTLPNPNCPEPKDPRHAIEHLELVKGCPYDPLVFAALKKIVKRVASGQAA